MSPIKPCKHLESLQTGSKTILHERFSNRDKINHNTSPLLFVALNENIYLPNDHTMYFQSISMLLINIGYNNYSIMAHKKKHDHII